MTGLAIMLLGDIMLWSVLKGNIVFAPLQREPQKLMVTDGDGVRLGLPSLRVVLRPWNKVL
jgi:hypothetical protein